MVAHHIKTLTVCQWPNKLGFGCAVNRIKFDVTYDRRLRRFNAWRMIGDRLVKFANLEFQESDDLRILAEIVYRAWKNRPEIWRE